MTERARGSSPDPTGLVDVEIVEGGTDETTDAPPPPRARRRRYLWWSGALVVVLALVVVANIVDSRQQAARLAALTEMPGVLEPMPEAPSVLWEAPGGWPLGVSDGLAVLHHQDGTLSGLDPETGTTRWSWGTTGADGAAPSCTPVLHRSAGWRRASLSTRELSHLVCHRVTAPPASGPVHLTVVEPASGAVSQEIGVGDYVPMTSGTVDGDFVLTGPDDDGYLRAGRWDLETGEQVWDYVSSSPDFTLGEGTSSSFGQEVLEVRAGSKVSIDLATGREVAEGREQAVGRTEPPREVGDGFTVTMRHSEGGPDAGAPTWQLRDAGGGLVAELPGPPTAPTLGDGAATDTLVVRDLTDGGSLLAVDRHSGEHLWSQHVDGGPVLHLAEVLVVVDRTGAAVGLDVRSGAELWEVDRVEPSSAAGLTDGRVVLLERWDDGGKFLAAHTLQDGAEVWRFALPDEVQYIDGLGGTLVMTTPETVTGLG